MFAQKEAAKKLQIKLVFSFLYFNSFQMSLLNLNYIAINC